MFSLRWLLYCWGFVLLLVWLLNESVIRRCEYSCTAFCYEGAREPPESMIRSPLSLCRQDLLFFYGHYPGQVTIDADTDDIFSDGRVQCTYTLPYPAKIAIWCSIRALF